ncbi:hypothetical protein [Moorena sp. SIO3H5]|uniref:hypothetical protein n=1 Tax=Moorena sp. SIO3H5 TaxID=2607834 RepID=UPI0013B80403|nr:hypothetical protein [Moorena sp. SIO3H5]NEO69579.1 hypothetical protein [Moorena sp. SIO3H5]
MRSRFGLCDRALVYVIASVFGDAIASVFGDAIASVFGDAIANPLAKPQDQISITNPIKIFPCSLLPTPCSLLPQKFFTKPFKICYNYLFFVLYSKWRYKSKSQPEDVHAQGWLWLPFQGDT